MSPNDLKHIQSNFANLNASEYSDDMYSGPPVNTMKHVNSTMKQEVGMLLSLKYDEVDDKTQMMHNKFKIKPQLQQTKSNELDDLWHNMTFDKAKHSNDSTQEPIRKQ